jgi:hypothetical protein
VDIASQIHVFNRNGTYNFRKPVPKDTLSLYSSSQIVFSPKAKVQKEAHRCARIEPVKLERVSAAKGLTAPFTGELSGEDIEHIRPLWIVYDLVKTPGGKSMANAQTEIWVRPDQRSSLKEVPRAATFQCNNHRDRPGRPGFGCAV